MQFQDSLTVEQAARLLSVSPRTIRRAVAAGSLPVRRVGRTVRLLREDLLQVRAATTVKP